MMVHRTGGKRGGNLEIDRQVTQLGATRKERRIRRSIGSGDAKMLKRVDVAIDKAIKDERWAVLKAYRDSTLSTADLLAGYRKKGSSRTLAGIRLRQPLWDRIMATTDGDQVVVGAVSRALGRVRGKANRNRYLQSFRSLQAKAELELPADATVLDLLAVGWDDLYERWGVSNTDWMHLRRALSRFATLHTGDKYSRFARKLRQMVPAKKVKKRRPKLSIEQFTAIVARTPLHARHSYWVLTITGVRVITEYLASGPQHLDKATLTYTPPAADKNEIGEFPLRIDARWWPFLERGIPSTLRYKWLRIYWKRACAEEGVEGVTLHDLRHCHGQWAINAKVAESKVQGSLRHENPAQTRDYVMQAGTLDVSSALYDAIIGTTPAPKRRKA